MTHLANHFSKLLLHRHQQPEKEDLTFLQHVVDQYPYFQAGKLLLTKANSLDNQLASKSQLPILAIQTYGRHTLYAELSETSKEEELTVIDDHNSPQVELPLLGFSIAGTIETSEDAPLIEGGKELFQYQPPIQEYHVGHRPAVKKAGGVNIKKRSLELIDQFLEKDEHRIEPGKTHPAEPLTDRSLDAPEDLVSETLAKIYAKQGKIKDAIKVYERLSLLEPEKRSKFARLIDELNQKDP